MEPNVSPELVASGVLLAAALIYLFRLAFSLWAKGYRVWAFVVGIPSAMYGFGLLAAGLGFGTFN